MNEISKTLEVIKNDKGYIDLIASNFLDFSIQTQINIPNQIILSEIKKYFNNHSYTPDPKGLSTTREAISKYYHEERLEIGNNNIIVTSSTSESYSQIFSSFTNPGEEILFPNPSYPLFEYLAMYANITPKFYKLEEENSWKIDIQGLEKQITNKTKGIVLISPNNPTGSIISDKEIDLIISIASKHNLFIIFDEVFSEFRKLEKFPRPIKNKDVPIFLLNGISKMLALPDLKLAWIAVLNGNEKILDKLETYNDTYLNANYLTQYILPSILQYRKMISEKINQIIDSNNQTLKEFLKTNSNHFSGNIGIGGIHNVIKINTDLNEESLVLKLLREKKISVHPGYFYDIENKTNTSHIIITKLLKNNSFKKALYRISNTLKAKS